MMRARMRSPRCLRSLCSAVQGAGDFAGDIRTHEIFVLLDLLIPILLLVHGGKLVGNPAVPPDCRRS